MTFDPQAVFDTIQNHALTSGWFERVGTHEPKNAPGTGLTCAIWSDHIGLVQSSGLDQSSVRVIFKVRVYSNMIQEPQDGIDPNVVAATCGLFAAYNTDFELGGEARHIDLLGSEGDPLYAEAGYLEVAGRMYRVMTISLPVIFNDAWGQSA